MKQYLDLLQNILDNGVEKESGRANMPNTVGISHGVIRMDMKDGFPLLTTKKMYWKGVVHELLWFLRGETNIKYLVDNGVHIWDSDAYRWYQTKMGKYNTPDGSIRFFSNEEFIEKIKNNELNTLENDYKLGDLGKVYGYQWRNQNGVDQVRDVIEGLRDNPYSRYHIIDGWNKVDFKDMALPPCHLLYQFIVRPLNAVEREDYYAKLHNFTEEQRWEMNPNATDEDVHKIMNEEGVPRFYLDLNMYQRSCDVFLGVPFNLASMSILLTLFAKVSNMIPGVATWIGGDTHLYVDHVPVVKEQLERTPRSLPKLNINKELHTLDDILSLTIDDFEITEYDPYPPLKAELFTGIKKI